MLVGSGGCGVIVDGAVPVGTAVGVFSGGWAVIVAGLVPVGSGGRSVGGGGGEVGVLEGKGVGGGAVLVGALVGVEEEGIGTSVGVGGIGVWVGVDVSVAVAVAVEVAVVVSVSVAIASWIRLLSALCGVTTHGASSATGTTLVTSRVTSLVTSVTLRPRTGSGVPVLGVGNANAPTVAAASSIPLPILLHAAMLAKPTDASAVTIKYLSRLSHLFILNQILL